MEILRQIIDATESVIKLSSKSVKYYCFRCKDYQHYLTDEPERDCSFCGARMERIPRSGCGRFKRINGESRRGTWHWSREIRRSVRLQRMARCP